MPKRLYVRRCAGFGVKIRPQMQIDPRSHPQFIKAGSRRREKGLVTLGKKLGPERKLSAVPSKKRRGCLTNRVQDARKPSLAPS